MVENRDVYVCASTLENDDWSKIETCVRVCVCSSFTLSNQEGLKKLRREEREREIENERMREKVRKRERERERRRERERGAPIFQISRVFVKEQSPLPTVGITKYSTFLL